MNVRWETIEWRPGGYYTIIVVGRGVSKVRDSVVSDVARGDTQGSIEQFSDERYLIYHQRKRTRASETEQRRQYPLNLQTELKTLVGRLC